MRKFKAIGKKARYEHLCKFIKRTNKNKVVK
jgi:hypothetical protein